MKTNQAVAQHEAQQPKVSNDSTISTTKLSAKESVLLEVLKAKMTEANSWVSYMVSTAAIFSILNVGLYKYALDANSTPPLRRALSWIGIALSVAGFVACIFMEHLRRDNRKEQGKLLRALQVFLEPDRLETVKYATITGAIGVLLNLISWLYLFVTTPK